MTTHFIPVDFNHDSICGLTKAEWEGGTNNWDWVSCPSCLECHPTKDAHDLAKAPRKDGPVRIRRVHGNSFEIIDPPSG